MPDETAHGPETRRDAEPLGADVAPPGDPESQGGVEGPGSGVAGPGFPPAGAEPDARTGQD